MDKYNNLNLENFNNPDITNRYNDNPSEDRSYLKRWNWGAFSLNIFWGIGNHCYLPLLCLIPVFNLIMIFICGVYGNRWAFKTGRFNSVRELENVQQSWNRAGIVCFVLSLISIALIILSSIFAFSIINDPLPRHIYR